MLASMPQILPQLRQSRLARAERLEQEVLLVLLVVLAVLAETLLSDLGLPHMVVVVARVEPFLLQSLVAGAEAALAALVAPALHLAAREAFLQQQQTEQAGTV